MTSLVGSTAYTAERAAPVDVGFCSCGELLSVRTSSSSDSVVESMVCLACENDSLIRLGRTAGK